MKYQDRQKLRRKAQDHFTRAAAALAPNPGFQVGDDPEALALIESGLGVVALAQYDEDGSIGDRVQAWLQSQMTPSELGGTDG